MAYREETSEPRAEALVRALRKQLRMGKGCALKSAYTFLLCKIQHEGYKKELQKGFVFIPETKTQKLAKNLATLTCDYEEDSAKVREIVRAL